MKISQKVLAKQVIDFLHTIPDNVTSSEMPRYIWSFLGRDFDIDRIRVLIPEGISEQKKINLYTVYALVSFFTHRYPDLVYGNEIVERENTLSKFKRAKSTLLCDCTGLDLPATWKRSLSEKLEESEQAVRCTMTAKFLSLSDFKNYSIAEFLSDAAVMKDLNFASSYTPRKWAELIAKTRQFSPVLPVASEQAFLRRHELYSATYMGENHTKCDDFSGVCKLDGDTWFAFSADGVGSVANSHIGARLAGHCFYACLARAYYRYSPEKLAFYIQHYLARDAGMMWREKLGRDFEKYVCTFLFSFGCRSFVACGMVGDGNFLIEKRDQTNEKGYLQLSDGFSDTSSRGVKTVGHLAKNPYCMRICFFSPGEIGGILMTSDGANGMLFEPYGEVLLPRGASLAHGVRYFDTLSHLSPRDIAQAVQKMCEKFSSANKVGGGRGDDCSVVYIKAKR